MGLGLCDRFIGLFARVCEFFRLLYLLLPDGPQPSAFALGVAQLELQSGLNN